MGRGASGSAWASPSGTRGGHVAGRCRPLRRRPASRGRWLYSVEAGQPTSIEALVRVAVALGLRLDCQLIDPRRRLDQRRELSGDPVHSAMGELEARHLRSLGISIGIDEPYQHYQFAGRADVVAWDVSARALLHIENRTRFPDFQDMAGSFNAKKAYLAESIGARVGIDNWASQTHVIAALWTSEVLRALRCAANRFARCARTRRTRSRIGGRTSRHSRAFTRFS